MGKSALRGLVGCVLLTLFPFSLFAADSNVAMLYTNGPTWVNGAGIPRPSSAIFSGDLLQTRSDSVASINQPGTMVQVLSDSLVQFEGSSVKIDHGGVMVSTSKGMATTAGDVRVAPATNAWTEFKVIDVDGTVRIAARKGDVTVTDGKGTVTLAQGQETTRDESPDNSSDNSKRKNRRRQAGAVPGASGGALNSPIAVGLGGAAAIGITTWVLIHNDDPASPAKP